MNPDFIRSGHRGARGLFPENTLPGFAEAIRLGVTSIELDVAISRDGVALVIHDPELNPDIVRGPDGAWLTAPGPAVWSLTAAELARCDVGRLRPGSRLAGLFPGQRPIDGARIPTLAAVLALAAPAGVTVDIELKTLPDRPELTIAPRLMAEAVLAVLDQGPDEVLVAVRSFDWRGLRHLRARRPALPLVYLTSPATAAARALWWDGVGEGLSVPQAVAAEAQGAAWRPIWAPAHDSLTPALLAEAHALGLGVVPWTVNDPADMARLIGWGVDGLCSDRPDLIPPT